MEEKVFVGYQWGSFENDKGVMQRFCSIFFLEPFPETSNPDYHTSGLRAAKYKLTSRALVKDLQPFDVVQVYFSSKGAVTNMVKVDKDAGTFLEDCTAEAAMYA